MGTIEEVIITLFCLWLFVEILGFLLNEGYKQGQIDSLNGKIKYKKERNEDGEEVWTKIK